MSYTPTPIRPFRGQCPFGQLVEEERRLLDEWMTFHAEIPNDTLYHYTSASGLLGILESEQLWMTHAAFLNDSSELEYAHGLILGILEEYRQNAAEKEVKTFINRAMAMLNVYRPDVSHFIPCISCFCEEGNLLSQWKAYSDGGSGYALGIEIGSDTRCIIDEYDQGNDRAPILRKVLYDRARQVRLIKEAVDALCDVITIETKAVRSIAEEAGVPADVIVSGCSHSLASVLAEYLLSFKNPAFAEEKEWRMIRVYDSTEPADPFHFRVTSNAMPPYIPLNIFDEAEPRNGRFPVSKVMIGPTRNASLSRQSLTLFLEKHNYDSFVDIEDSGIPLRRM